ncbi:hypothetical protein WJX74_005153 [Apatococcus lobatus]|uniref:LOV domain-containing protein n=1 Tax=Apatococcus lobatus TaxID=904363 RepID=A0AAW1QW96_9CHLO
MANPYSTSEDEKLAANADNFLSCITVLDGAEQKHQIAYMDKAYEQLSGYGRDELLGRPFLEMCADATTVTLESALTESQQVPSQLDLSMRKKDGSRYQCSMMVMPVNDKHGNRIKSVLVHVEASPSLESQAEAKEGKELDTRRQDLFARAPQAYLMTQGSGSCMILRGLQGAEVMHEEVTGYALDDIQGQSCFSLCGPETGHKAIKELSNAHLTGHSCRSKMLCYRRDGTPLWLYLVSFPLATAASSSLKSPQQPQQLALQPQVQPQIPASPTVKATTEAALKRRASTDRRSSTGPVEPPKSDSAGKTESPGKPESPATIKSGPSRTHSVMPPAAQHLCLLLDITARKPRRIGKYIMGKQLGRGAFGTVRLGKDPATGDLVAIKEIDAGNFRNISQIEQIQEEINVLSNLKHPNIIHLLESIFIGKMVYVIMEYVAGGSLMDFVNSQPDGKLSETEARRILQQLLEALDYCHRRRIIHRDLKPENVLLDLQSNIRVADFGLAAITTPMSGNLQMACGTPEFTAPEILKGREYVGTAVDIWSLGVMLYEMIRGELPFRASGSTDLVKLVSSGRYKPMEGVGRDCRDLVSKMLTVQPADRITLDSIRRHPWSEGFSPDDDEGAEDALPSAHDSAADPTAEPVDDSMQRSLHLVLPDSLASASDDEGSKAPGVIKAVGKGSSGSQGRSGQVRLRTGKTSLDESPAAKPLSRHRSLPTGLEVNIAAAARPLGPGAGPQPPVSGLRSQRSVAMGDSNADATLAAQAMSKAKITAAR